MKDNHGRNLSWIAESCVELTSAAIARRNSGLMSGKFAKPLETAIAQALAVITLTLEQDPRLDTDAVIAATEAKIDELRKWRLS